METFYLNFWKRFIALDVIIQTLLTPLLLYAFGLSYYRTYLIPQVPESELTGWEFSHFSFFSFSLLFAAAWQALSGLISITRSPSNLSYDRVFRGVRICHGVFSIFLLYFLISGNLLISSNQLTETQSTNIDTATYGFLMIWWLVYFLLTIYNFQHYCTKKDLMEGIRRILTFFA